MSNAFLTELFGLTGRTAVVIGGTGVIGGALCSGLAKAGAAVVVAGRGADRGLECVEAIVRGGGQAAFADVDVTDRASVEALLATALQTFGRVDLLVNCAGVNSATPYFDIADDEWDRILSINLRGVHLACQTFGRYFLQRDDESRRSSIPLPDHQNYPSSSHASASQKSECPTDDSLASRPEAGAIINIGSVSAEIPLSKVFAYSASKAGVVNLTRNLAREWAPHGVRVNAICPGFFPAEQNRKILTAERSTNVLRHTPMGRFGNPDELIGAALLLASPTAGSFITGAVLYVDGGFTAMTI